ncbi:MAG: tRNA pseudouridine(55) synthase TruB [Cyanobacteria bacterium]|nr:tRNA pseudouridine(55) synthase TruB [Cyanobacteriota bacterium]MDA1020642.1 tRNA pseudouridine(55) synthase TruB [Cyanobacteriota bacterium]
MANNNFDHQLNGFLIIDKPIDWTSHDVVAKLRGILRTKKVGHAGTLDPFATGVLPIAVGSATRLIRFLAKTKRYLAEIDLRNTTDTDDLTGEFLNKAEIKLSKEDLLEKLKSMEGEIDQIPPLYSAKKIDGKKLYQLMREGYEIDLADLKPCRVRINSIDLLDFDYPFAKIEMSCGEGTYVRSVARDVGGHLTSLRRLESNNFTLQSAYSLDDLQAEGVDLHNTILSPVDYLDLPEYLFDNKDVIALQQGQKVTIKEQDLSRFIAEDPFLSTNGTNASHRSDLFSSDITSKTGFCRMSSQFSNKLIDLEQGEQYLKCLDSTKELIGLANIAKENGKDFAVQPKVIL